MADANLNIVNTRDKVEPVRQAARMPHLEMDRGALDVAFPSLDAVEQDTLHDLEGPDPTLEHGEGTTGETQRDDSTRSHASRRRSRG